MKKNDQLTLEILDLTYEGKGIAKVDGYPLFVDNALPGEQVKATILNLKKDYGFAKTIEIIKKSPDRVEVDDARFIQSGIAPLLFLKYDQQLIFKQTQIKNLLNKAHLTQELTVNETIGMENPYEYRNKALIPVRELNHKLQTGFYRRHSHELIPMENFLIQEPGMDELIIAVRDILSKYQVQAYNEADNSGQIRNIMIRKGHFTNQFMVALITTKEPINHLDEITKEIQALPDVVSVVRNINNKKTNVLLGTKNKTLSGFPYIEDEILGNTYRISPNSFFQVNSVQTQNLYQLAIDKAELTGNEMVVDAYSGIGTIGLSMADKVKEVHGIEVVEAAVKDANKNAEINDIKNATFEVGKVETVLKKWAEEGRKVDVLMVDPPRKGLDASLIETIQAIKPQKIVYISCNPSTLVRDLQNLESDYKISSITPVDMFPMTNHVESVTSLILK
ncbi:23S rRNA (uracil(1939)-C(5))-methyltransferase RlmD [Lactobacillus sp. YT155]|uniref:23S rRNA (uracil(1939)-C(5))-methyltransferase RlmD n=1 Tax=Lactobacillus sp. YT155 TaxID=3060955 RepID=UPI0026603691|nr:23S rRNA (uracil(1939)-C(5))-methyltransferase RlmD [Lactobacillus sp. YT155]MDO1605208.1 23S rRNA (uracil(1939)-C(5))-methyltransferase RlmD [Lactobacillus sp. YT155]